MTTAIERAQRLEQEFGNRPKQLELWREQLRGVSKILSNSALFSVRDKRTPRVRYEDHVVKSLQNIVMRYSGVQLDQDDHSVFMQLCHLARAEPFGTPVKITGLVALKGLGWDSSKESYERLFNCYKRMLEGTVYITTTDDKKRAMYGSHLLRSVGAQDEIEGDPSHTRWTIVLDPALANILTGDELTLIDWVRHYKLSGFAKWLHNFYSSHEKPLPYKAETLHGLCGSKQADSTNFRFKLKKALAELVAAEFLEAFSVGPKPSYLVTVRRVDTTRLSS